MIEALVTLAIVFAVPAAIGAVGELTLLIIRNLSE